MDFAVHWCVLFYAVGAFESSTLCGNQKRLQELSITCDLWKVLKKKKYIPSVIIICDIILVEPFYLKQTNKKASKVPADNTPVQLHVCEICCISVEGHTWQLLDLPRTMEK